MENPEKFKDNLANGERISVFQAESSASGSPPGTPGSQRTALILALCALIALVGWLGWQVYGRGTPLTPLTWEELAPPPEAAMRPWTHLVIHHSDSRKDSVASIDRWHRQKGWDGIGYHLVIGNGVNMSLGIVEPTFRWRNQREGAHAGGGEQGRPYNQLGIGICLIGKFNEEAPDPVQEARLAELCALLIRHVPTLSAARIIGHRDVPGKGTDCPGQLLDVERIRYLVRQRLAGAGD